MSYIGPIIALLTGVLGIFFSKSGDRQKLNSIAYLLLVLVATSGVVSLFGIYDAQRSAREAKDKADAQAKRATAEAVIKEAELRREKASADTFRNLLIARTFAPDDMPADGLLLLDLPRTPAEERAEADTSGVLWPMLGKGIRAAHLTFSVEDVLDLDYYMRPVGAGAAIDANWYAFGPKACRLTSESGYEFAATPGSACTQAGGYKLNAQFEPTTGGGDSSHVNASGKFIRALTNSNATVAWLASL